MGAIVGLYQPTVQINLDSAIEGREIWLARIGLYSFWALALASVVGAVLIRRKRDVPVFPLLVPPHHGPAHGDDHLRQHPFPGLGGGRGLCAGRGGGGPGRGLGRRSGPREP